LPVWIEGNVYFNNAIPSVREHDVQNFVTVDPGVQLVEENGSGYLNFNLDQSFFDHHVKLISSDILGKAKIPKTSFENTDGTPFILDEDYYGNRRTSADNLAGPFFGLKPGKSSMKLW
jgi:hypothetical protein